MCDSGKFYFRKHTVLGSFFLFYFVPLTMPFGLID